MSITELREFATIVENQTKQQIKFDNMIKKQDEFVLRILLTNSLGYFKCVLTKTF